MKKTFNKETGKTTWQIDTWYQKSALIFGWISVAYIVIAFTTGFIVGVAGL